MKRIRKKKKIALIVFFCIGIILAVFLSIAFIQLKNNRNNTSNIQADTLIQLCKHQKYPTECYGDKFYQLTKQQNLEQVLPILKLVERKDPQAQYCHPMAHKIAAAEVAKDPNHFYETLAKLDIEDCERGFFHGAIEGYTGYNKKFELTKKTIYEICQHVGGAYKSVGREAEMINHCHHTIGHLIIVQEEGDLKKSENLCDEVPDKYKRNCFAGVYMENTIKRNLAEHGFVKRPIISEEGLIKEKSTCRNVSGEAASACWQIIGMIYTAAANYDLAKLEHFCSDIENVDNKRTCYTEGAAFIAANRTNSMENKEKALAFCNIYKEDMKNYRHCITRVTQYMISVSTDFISSALLFCDNILSEYKSYCYEKVSTNKTILRSKDTICNEAKGPVEPFCKKYLNT